MSTTQAPVAQLDRVPDYGSGGWGFESSRAHHFLNDLALSIDKPAGCKSPLSHQTKPKHAIEPGFGGIKRDGNCGVFRCGKNGQGVRLLTRVLNGNAERKLDYF